MTSGSDFHIKQFQISVEQIYLLVDQHTIRLP